MTPQAKENRRLADELRLMAAELKREGVLQFTVRLHDGNNILINRENGTFIYRKD